MLSKSKGQILRIAATLNVLFHLDNLEVLDEEGSKEISDSIITAAINLVETCCQQTAYIAGRGDIKEEIDVIQASKKDDVTCFGHCSGQWWCGLDINTYY